MIRGAQYFMAIGADISSLQSSNHGKHTLEGEGLFPTLEESQLDRRCFCADLLVSMLAGEVINETEAEKKNRQ